LRLKSLAEKALLQHRDTEFSELMEQVR
jgi:hypothetical protein